MSEHTELASTHEPAPTGQGAVILDFATARCRRKANVATARADYCFAKNLSLVEEALTARAEMGKAKYGTYLRSGNGRNALVDMYQEILDAIMYAEQAYYELFGDGNKYTKDEDRPAHLLVAAEKLDALYLMAAEIAPFVKKAA